MKPRLNSSKSRLKSLGASKTHDGASDAPNAPTGVFEGVLALASCRAAHEGSDALWFETFPPYGRYPVGGTVEGAKDDAEFIIDEAAAKSVIDNFRAAQSRADWPGVLVDREHFSADRGKTSDAMAWARDIRQDADGSIWTRWEFTAPGRELWDGKVLVSRSPYFACEREGKDYRPVALLSVAMTNTPHFSELSTLAAARAAEVTNKQGEIQMDKIIEALGLGEGATEEDVIAALDALKQKASDAVAKAEEAEKEKDEAVAECRALKAEAFVAANAGKIADVAAAKAAYVKDPATAEAILAACRAPTAGRDVPDAPQQILAAAKAAPQKATREALSSLPPSERAAYYRDHASEIG